MRRWKVYQLQGFLYLQEVDRQCIYSRETVKTSGYMEGLGRWIHHANGQMPASKAREPTLEIVASKGVDKSTWCLQRLFFFCQKSMHKPARLSQGLVISTSQSFVAQPVCICPMTIKQEQDIQLPAKKRTGYTTEQEQDALPLAGLSYLCIQRQWKIPNGAQQPCN